LERAAARRVVDRERRRGARGPPQVVEGPAVDEAFREAPAAAGQDDGLAAAHRVGDGGDVVAADPRDLARAHPRGVGRPLVSAGQYERHGERLARVERGQRCAGVEAPAAGPQRRLAGRVPAEARAVLAVQRLRQRADGLRAPARWQRQF